ncbi:hypothetical protein K438DRAFT_864652 [Mycena galopus ATCC 62051]|nr:hypothetical protein K438DRAFT_864652 [Mycena galopus ATCC 62051]
MALIDLNPDVLLPILADTDIYTILSVARVNRLLYEITSLRHLWLLVIRDLSRRRLIDAAPEETLQALSKEELVDEIRRVVTGPRTWSSASSTLPTLLRQFIIPLDPLPPAQDRRAELLPGGTHIILSECIDDVARKIECWDVRTQKRVWAWERTNHNVEHATWE